MSGDRSQHYKVKAYYRRKNKRSWAGCVPPDYSRSAEALAAARGGPPEPSIEGEGHVVLQGFYAAAAAGETCPPKKALFIEPCLAKNARCERLGRVLYANVSFFLRSRH